MLSRVSIQRSSGSALEDDCGFACELTCKPSTDPEAGSGAVGGRIFPSPKSEDGDGLAASASL